MKYLAHSALLFFALVGRSQSIINEAENAFFNQELESSKDLYSQVYCNKSLKNKNRAEAGRMLAYISYHFYDDLEKARKYVYKSLDFKINEDLLYRDLISYECQEHNYSNAKNIYKEAIQKLNNDKQIKYVNIAYVNVILSEAFNKIDNNESLDHQLLEEALEIVKAINNLEPGNLKSAKLQLGLSLLLNDGCSAMDAWNLYYYIPNEKKAEGLLTKPQKELNQILIYRNKTELKKDNKESIVLNIAASGFYEFAYSLSKYWKLPLSTVNPKIKDIYNYYEFILKLEDRVYKYYKDFAITGNNNISEVEKEVETVQKQFWKNLYWEKKAPKYSKIKFENELYKRFGTMFYIGNFYNNYFYIAGHTIVDTTLIVSQFNYDAQIQYSILDNRFSNNYWGWFTGYMGFAGYANESMIAKYREPSAEQPIIFWNKLTNDKLLEKWKADIEKFSKEDESVVKNGLDATLFGIHSRVRLKVYTQIIDSLKTEGYKDKELRVQFLSVFNDIVHKRNLFHEGRHAIDFNILSKKELHDNIELEYRARLSQIHFSNYPLLEIGFEIDNTPHGLANKKILLALEKWMLENTDLIIGFDKNKSVITQIDKLTDDQIKQIALTIEPFVIQ